MPSSSSFSSSSSTSTSLVSSSKPTKVVVQKWNVRPATIQDRDFVTTLLHESYSNLLQKDYGDYNDKNSNSKNSNNSNFLLKALPSIAHAQEELLTCGTWYVVEHEEEEEGNEQDEEDNEDDEDKDNEDTTTTKKKKKKKKKLLIGCGGWTQRQHLKSAQTMNTSSPHLRHFATHPNFTRMGVAKAIWDRTLQDIQQAYNKNNTNNTNTNINRSCEDNGHDDDSTTTSTYTPTMEVFSTITAEKFYQSLGFQTIQHMTVPINDQCDFPCILMRRQEEFTTTLCENE